MLFTTLNSGKKVELNDSNLVGAGGEGAVHIVENIAYKVCHDRFDQNGREIPFNDKKINELMVLDHPDIIRPIDILLNSRRKKVGYTMKAAPSGSMPLAQIISKTYREREGLKQDQMSKLVKRIADGLRFIHSHDGYLQVDANEWNYMVTSDYRNICFIDVNSFETPSFPADAIMASIRDWNCPVDPSNRRNLWSKLTDWYSYAIISWMMFTGIHPYKQFHPKFTNNKTKMVDQMTAGVSILDPESTFPKGAVYFPFEDFIPGGKSGAYMQWYRAIFLDNKRLEPPVDFQAVVFIASKIKEINGSNNFTIRKINDFDSMITAFYEKNNVEVVVTEESIYLGSRKFPKINGKIRVGFYGSSPVVVSLENGVATLIDLENQTQVTTIGGKSTFSIMASAIMSYDGRLYIHCDENIYEVILTRQDKLSAMVKKVASCLPLATRFFQGVVVQEMFESVVVSVFPASGSHQQFIIKELNKLAITDAKYENGVLMVIASDKEGEATRFVIRLGENRSYDLIKIERVSPIGLNFTVVGNVVVNLNEEEKIEIFLSQKGSSDIKVIDDPAISGQMRLFHSGKEVRYADGNSMFAISVKK